MKNSKLISILKTLTPQAFKRFIDFTHSPYFNKHKGVQSLLLYLKKFHPHYGHPKFDLEKIFKGVWKKEPFSEQKIRNVMTMLTKLLERFLTLEELESRPVYQDYLLLHNFHKRYLDKQFIYHYQAVQKSQSANKQRDVDYYHDQFLLGEIAYSFDVVKRNRPLATHLTSVIQSFDTYYLANRLKYCCVLLNRSSVVAAADDLLFLDYVLDYVSHFGTQNSPLIAVYYQLLLTLKEEHQPQHYTVLKQQLRQHTHQLSKDELRQIYTAAFNYCNKQLKGGQPHFLREIFDLYKAMLAQEVLLVEGYISPYQHFRNIVMAALRLGELDWAKKFIENHQSQLRLSYRENMVNYCLAAYYFYKKEYAQTLAYLLLFEFQDFYNYIEHKTLLIKTYFELSEFESLIATLNTFRQYLRRNESIPQHIQLPYQNFIKIANYLVKWKNSHQTPITDLHKLVEPFEYLAEREWLVEKLKDMNPHA